MSSLDAQTHRQDYWRSLDELADAPEFRAFLEAEFPAAAEPGHVSRRRWLQLMGASLALAGVGGCRWKKEELLPFAKRPENRVPGKPQRFATAIDCGCGAVGLMVTSVDGRPIKIEGSGKHPASLGATDALTQAAILGLYDPDRSRGVVEKTAQGDQTRTWEQATELLRARFSQAGKAGGAGLRVLAEPSSSPARAALKERLLQAMPRAQWHEYEPLSADEAREGTRLAFGAPLQSQLVLDKAELIVCLDADLFGGHPDRVRLTRQFAAGRTPEAEPMKRLYSIEGVYTVTGAVADHRLPLQPSRIGEFARALASDVQALIDGKSPRPAAGDAAEAVTKFLRAVAQDLVTHQGRSVVVAGPSQPAEVHAAVHRLNAALGNAGKTLVYFADPQPQRLAHRRAIETLVSDIREGRVETLLVLGGNPVYDAPADVQFASALEKVPVSIHLSLYRDETSRRCGWHLPQAHFLECWGDVRAADGTYSLVQPLIAPLHGGKSALEVLLSALGDSSPNAYELVRQTFQQVAGEADWQARWDQALHEGVLAKSQWPAVSAQLAAAGPSAAGAVIPASRWDGGELEIVFCPSASVHDGRYANNAWLQETPDPMTKLTWDNAALLGPATAKSLKVEHGTLVRVSYGGRSVELPVYVMPGQAPGLVAVALGYGRTAAGHVGGSQAEQVATVGVDLYPLRTSRAMYFDAGAKVEEAGPKRPLATTQDHFAIDTVGMAARGQRVGELIREGSLEHYRQHPEFARHAVHVPELQSLWKEPSPDAETARWAMTIDLSKCVGCNACVVACQAENNVPVVGKERVLRGREMHWIRVDRYFHGDPESAASVHQPVACHHCENAPCEEVCPVAATVHSREGLNDMVYNRCVGTRYCANNCPYKVRRFNFFNYHKDLEDAGNEVLKMLYNPEVTVRSRGVMEKCTFCVQRIQAAKIDAKNHRRAVQDGEIQTACQQVCPANAIVFGDLGDPAGQPATGVAKSAAAPRAYQILAELNNRPRTSYLARIRNPNPELEGHDAHASG